MEHKRKLTIAAATAAIISTSATALCGTQLHAKAPSAEPIMELRMNGNELRSLFDNGTGVTARMINDSITEMKENANKDVAIKAEPIGAPKETVSPSTETVTTTNTTKEIRKVMKSKDILEFEGLAVEMQGVSPISLAICLLAQYGEDEWTFKLKEGESTELKAVNYDMEKTSVFDVKVEKLGYNGLSLTAEVSIRLKSVN